MFVMGLWSQEINFLYFNLQSYFLLQGCTWGSWSTRSTACLTAMSAPLCIISRVSLPQETLTFPDNLQLSHRHMTKSGQREMREVCHGVLEKIFLPDKKSAISLPAFGWVRGCEAWSHCSHHITMRESQENWSKGKQRPDIIHLLNQCWKHLPPDSPL